MPFRDEYTDFTFNGKTSEQMKVWITNSRDIQFRLTPEFTDTFVSPAFSNSQVLTGTNITKSTFQLKCIAIDVSMGEWRAIQRWLSPDAVGRLEFNFNYDTYYNAKISKSITGKSFVKGGYDKLLGDLYVVEFTVDFTTVDDYAALGPVNVGVINQTYNLDKINKKQISQVSITGSGVSVTNNSVGNVKTILGLSYDQSYNVRYMPKGSGEILDYTIPVVNDLATSNNPYFLPIFTKESNAPKNIGNKTVKFSLPSSSVVSSTAGVLAYYFRPGDEQKETAANYNASYAMKIGAIDAINKTCYLDIYGSRDGGDSLDTKITSIQLTCPSGSTTYISDDVSIFSEDIFYRKVNDSLNITFPNQTNYYHICNTGSYDMYPEFYIRPNSGNTSFSIQYNQQDHYKYIYAFNSSSYVTINARHGLVLSGNTLAEEVYVYNTNLNDNTVQRKAMFGNAGRVNQGIMAIPPGNAESLRCIVTKIEDVKITSTDNTGDLKLLHINTNHPLQFTHNHAIMHLFIDVKRSDAFNHNLYPQTARASEYRSYEHSFIDGHVLKESAIYYKSPCSYTIIGPSAELEGIKTDMNYYLSVCDASLLRIDGQGYIYLQSRGAF